MKISEGSVSAAGFLHEESASVLFGTLDGTCASLDTASGEIRWSQKLDNPIFSSPVVTKQNLAIFCDVCGNLSSFDLLSGSKVGFIV